MVENGRKHSIDTLTKHIRNNIEAEQKRVRWAEIQKINKILHDNDALSDNKLYSDDARNKMFRAAEKRDVSMSELKNCGIDIIRRSSSWDIGAVADGIIKVHNRALKLYDIGLYFNDALTNKQQKTLYQAVMDCAGDSDKIGLIEHIAKPKYTVDEMNQAVEIIKNGGTRERIDTLFMMNELYKIDEFTEGQKNILRAAYEHDMPKRQILRLANHGLSEKQMRELIYGYNNGLSEKEIALVSTPNCPPDKMHTIIYGMEHGADFEYLKKSLKTDGKLDFSISKEELLTKVNAAIKVSKKRSVPIRDRITNSESGQKPKTAHKKTIDAPTI